MFLLNLITNKYTLPIALIVMMIGYVYYINTSRDLLQQQVSELIVSVNTQKEYIERVDATNQLILSDIDEQTNITAGIQLQYDNMAQEYSALSHNLSGFKQSFELFDKQLPTVSMEVQDTFFAESSAKVNQAIITSYGCIESATGNKGSSCTE